MPKTIQIRDIDDAVYAALVRRAAEAGITVPELLRREATRLAARPTVEEWLARTRRRPSNVSRSDVLDALDDQRAAHGPMLVVDASCLFEVVADTRGAEPIRRRLASDPDQAAPHVVDAEVLGVIRRHHLTGDLDATAAAQAVDDLRDWPGERYGHRGLLARAWDLRETVRSWDGLYVALAEALGATLLTTDARLARAQGPSCPIEVVDRALA